jgi:endonuclease/exonuclease/phosphatase family metal-dependent hydrolase
VPLPGHKIDTPKRLYQSEAILNMFEEKGAVIIGGDFNLLPHTQSVQTFVEQGYRNLITEFDIKTTRNQITYERHPDNIQYYADYAFVSPAIEVIDFIVPTDIVSDHQPLELTFNCLAPVPSPQATPRPQFALTLE